MLFTMGPVWDGTRWMVPPLQQKRDSFSVAQIQKKNGSIMGRRSSK